MTLTVLHTSDWHLGAPLYGHARGEEHARFLTWLLGALTEHKVDVLVVAGDVFHQATPSADAQEAYFGFLARVAALGTVRQVVVVAGNHDSPARIDAPGAVLGALRVHVVGEIVGERVERCLCPIESDTGEVELVVAAVPFVHEFRLGVRTTGRSPAEVHADLCARFRTLYTELADRATQRWPGARLIATGHLTCTGTQPGDYATELHMASSVGALGPDVFDERYEYVALGHIHRAYAVDAQQRVWYAGAPVPVRFDEARTAGQVLLVRLGEERSVERIDVPCSRRLVKLVGEPDDLIERLQALELDGELAPFVHVEAVVERLVPGLAAQLLAALERNPRQPTPLLLAAIQTRARGLSAEPRPTRARLRELDAEQVFVALHRARRGGDPEDDLLRLFRRVVADVGDGAGAETPVEVDVGASA